MFLLSKNILPTLGITAAASAIDEETQKKKKVLEQRL